MNAVLPLLLFLLAVAAPMGLALAQADLSALPATLPVWGRTALAAGAGAGGALLLGLPVGWILARGRRREAGLLLALTLAQALLPTTLSCIGWIAAFGSQGLLPLPWLFTAKGVALAWAFAFWPLCALGAWAGLARAEASQEEALSLVLPARGVALRYSLGRALPGALLGAGCAGILMAGDLGIPGALRVGMGAEAVHARLSLTWNLGEAAGMSLPPLLGALLLAAWAFRNRQALDFRGDPAGAACLERVTRFLKPVAFAAAGLSLAVPAAGLAGWAAQGGGVVAALSVLGGEGRSTLAVSLAAATAGAGLAFWMAWALRGHPRILLACAAAALTAFALPGTLAGVGLLRLWNAPDWRGTVYASPAILGLAALGRTFGPCLLLARGALASVPASLDEAAVLEGVPGRRRALALHLPLCAGGLGAAWILTAALSAGEVAASTMISPPGMQTLAPRLFSLIHFGADAAVGWAALLWMGGAGAAGLALARIRGAR